MTTKRLRSAAATSTIFLAMLSATGCVSMRKMHPPQWLSFNRDQPADTDTVLPEPSSLAVPTTVTQPTASSPAGQLAESQADAASSTMSPEVTLPASLASSATAPATNAVTVVPANTYPTTNQPAPQSAGGAPSAGFLPNTGGIVATTASQNPATVPASPATNPAAPPQNTVAQQNVVPQQGMVQQGPYGAPGASAAGNLSAPDAQPMPASGSPIATTTWNQPKEPKPPASTALASNTAPDSGGSIYGADPIGTTMPTPNGNSVYGTTAPAVGAEASTTYEPEPYNPPTTVMPSADMQAVAHDNSLAQQESTGGVAQATYNQPSEGSHYGQMAKGAASGNANWRPGSTTDYVPTITR